jgi:hypothetical protein
MVDLQTLFPKEKLLLGIPQQQLFNGFIYGVKSRLDSLTD